MSPRKRLSSASFALDELEQQRDRVAIGIVWLSVLLVALFGVWAYHAQLDEVATGQGVVVPSSREQVIQSLEGGIVAEIRVREGDIVEAGQILAVLDATVTEASMEEVASKYRAAVARAARLKAELEDNTPVFPDHLALYPYVISAEQELYTARLESVNRAEGLVNRALESLHQELEMTQTLVDSGAASSVDLLRIQRDIYDQEMKLAEIHREYKVGAQEDYVRVSAEVDSLAHTVTGRTDALSRMVLRAPMRGIVKDVEITTIGGVLPPNGRLMDIVPLDDQLVFEVKVTPRDIAFISPGQAAQIKITAYDYSIFGGLEGEVFMISPDTIQDDVNREEFYYRVLVRTQTDALLNERGDRFPIWPGMMSIVDIKTGQKTVMQYLLLPINRAREALRER